MELEVCEDVAGKNCYWELFRIDIVGFDGLPDADAVSIRTSKFFRIQLSDKGEAAEKGFAETYTLFFREADDLDRNGKIFPLEFFNDGHSENNTEDAIEGSGVGHRVEVRTDEDTRRTRRRPRTEPVQIADSIHGDGHPSI